MSGASATGASGRWRWLRRYGEPAGILALFVLGASDLVQHYNMSGGLALGLSAVRALPLLICRYRPLLAWWIELGAVTVTALIGAPVSLGEPWPWAVTSVAAVAIAAGVIGARGQRWFSAAIVGLVGVLGAALRLAFPDRGDWDSVVLLVLFCAVAVVLGDTSRARRAVAAELAHEQRVSAVERGRREMVEERARIARELHDVVAHHMSVITVQAETARYRLGADLPETVFGEFDSIARAARGSLTEMRQLLSALRARDGNPEHEPQPGFDGLDALVARTKNTGSEVRLTVTPDADALREIPDAVQLSGYRIIQEAMSNVVRHAPGARVEVRVRLANSVLHIEVSNECSPGGSTAPPGSGHGLVGLRERAALLGGTLEVDRPAGGWRVRAELPAGSGGNNEVLGQL